MSNFDPIRDCPHGRQKGKCDSCDLEQAEKIIEQQQQRIVELERKLQLEEELHHVAESGFTELFTTIEQQQELIEELEQFNLEAIKLLDVAICPCCDKSGAYYDNNGEVCQCQWCYEVSRLPRPPKGER